MKNITIVILPGSQQPFEENEINSLKMYLNEGGKILVLLVESNQDDLSNVNILLEEYGIYPEMGKNAFSIKKKSRLFLVFFFFV